MTVCWLPQVTWDTCLLRSASGVLTEHMQEVIKLFCDYNGRLLWIQLEIEGRSLKSWSCKSLTSPGTERRASLIHTKNYATFRQNPHHIFTTTHSLNLLFAFHNLCRFTHRAGHSGSTQAEKWNWDRDIKLILTLFPSHSSLILALNCVNDVSIPISFNEGKQSVTCWKICDLKAEV